MNLLLLLLLIYIYSYNINNTIVTYILFFFLQNNINTTGINYSLNINLLNGIFLIHPILIYLFYRNNIFSFILSTANKFFNKFSLLNYFLYNIFFFKKICKKNNKIIILAIVLGS